jgi:cytochrome c oxidase subunit IV
MTLFKAGYIVMVFMHLGDEKKTLRNIILIPYFIFILYLIFIALWESLAINDALQNNAF